MSGGEFSAEAQAPAISTTNLGVGVFTQIGTGLWHGGGMTVGAPAATRVIDEAFSRVRMKLLEWQLLYCIVANAQPAGGFEHVDAGVALMDLSGQQLAGANVANISDWDPSDEYLRSRPGWFKQWHWTTLISSAFANAIANISYLVPAGYPAPRGSVGTMQYMCAGGPPRSMRMRLYGRQCDLLRQLLVFTRTINSQATAAQVENVLLSSRVLARAVTR